MHEFKVKFYLRAKDNLRTGYRSVLVRIYLDHQRDNLTSSHIAVPADAWNANTERVMLRTPIARLMNRRLDNLRKTITDIYHLHAEDDHLSIALIKQTYQSQVESKMAKPSVCTFFESYIKENEEVIGVDNRYRFTQIATLFKQYVVETYQAKDIDFEDIDLQMLEEFETYLRERLGYTHHRTLKNMLRFLHTLFGAAQELGMVAHSPFKNYRPCPSRTATTDLLTVEDIKRMKKAALGTKRLDKVRDCFLFSCYTGLSYKEVRLLSRTMLTKLNGKDWLVLGNGIKDVPRYIPLLPYPASIIKKYATDDDEAPLLPLISQQKTNQYLKEIGELCGIGKSLTFRVATQSFMKIALSSGASVDSLTHMLGQHLRRASTFSNFSPERIEEEMTLFAAKMGRDPPADDDIKK